MTEQPPLTYIIQKRRLMLFSHLARMDETADARKILTGVHQSDWSRPVGRPYTSWMATLKSDLSLHNLTFEDAIKLALDKSLWRLLVASGATHWHGACRIMMKMMMVSLCSPHITAGYKCHFRPGVSNIWPVGHNPALQAFLSGPRSLPNFVKI